MDDTQTILNILLGVIIVVGLIVIAMTLSLMVIGVSVVVGIKVLRQPTL